MGINGLRDAVQTSDCMCRIGEIHREFGPSNILVSNEGIAVLDAACNEQGPHLLDAAVFTAYLRVLPFFSPRTVRFCQHLEGVFLAGYFGLASNATQFPKNDLFSLLLVNGILRNLDRHVTVSSAFPAPLRSMAQVYVARNYRRTLAALLDLS